MGLTVKSVGRLIEPGRYADGHGLYLQVVSATNRSWLFRYQRGGRERWLGLGPLHTIDLVQARQRARQARQSLLDGIDPLEARKAEKATRDLASVKALSFEQAALAYFDQHERKWRSAKHRNQFLSTLREYAFPVIGRLSVAAIDTGLVLKVVEPIWLTKTETADRVRSRIESVLGWATVRNYRTGDNPARWKNHLAEVLPARASIAKPQHHAALAYDELPALIAAMAGREGMAARALEFVILTAARTSEVTGAVWSEIDLAARTWTVPANRIKGGREHKVPLSGRALEILKRCRPSAATTTSSLAKSKAVAGRPPPWSGPGSAWVTVMSRFTDSDSSFRGLGRGADELFRSCRRAGAGPCHRQCGRASLSKGRPVREAHQIDGRLGPVLHHAGRACGQRGRAVAMTSEQQIKAALAIIDPAAGKREQCREFIKRGLREIAAVDIVTYLNRGAFASKKAKSQARALRRTLVRARPGQCAARAVPGYRLRSTGAARYLRCGSDATIATSWAGNRKAPPRGVLGAGPAGRLRPESLGYTGWSLAEVGRNSLRRQ